ncbi:NAD(P)/FAD-dependent oxidoreductase [Phenylobacterium sp.]|uniref:NAD(P)/FAD-dependent oxidoreductase n=1 Tax=Phenylobacterium sp. TaxID=1871053 RepID=UPI0035AFCD8A
MKLVDVLIVGGGIAGVSLAARLAGRLRVLLLEREAILAMHTTGRSAALFSEAYGCPPVRQWTRESRAFFDRPPEGFADTPLLTPRPFLSVARPEEVDQLRAHIADNPGIVRAVSPAEALRAAPFLRPDQFVEFAEEPASADIDVGALFDGFRRMALAGGVEIATAQPVTGLDRREGGWRVSTPDEEIEARVVVNAAGAWAGEFGRMAGLGDLGLVPKRRTAIVFEPPADVDISAWPFTGDISEQFYLKPEAGLILASPADETPSPPCDAQPEELDVATIAYRIEEATTLPVKRIRRRWAGLRTFTPNRTPFFGFDEAAEGFFWLAGQGGYGIQTAPSISERAAAMIRDRI